MIFVNELYFIYKVSIDQSRKFVCATIQSSLQRTIFRYETRYLLLSRFNVLRVIAMFNIEVIQLGNKD